MKNTLTAIATVAFSIAALISIRSPLMPLFATAGAAGGAHLLTVHPGSKSRGRQVFEAEVEARERELEQQQQQRSQLVVQAKTELQSHQSYLEEKEQQLNQYKEQLIQQEKEMRQWAEEHQQRVMSLAVKTLHENHRLKQPDLPEGATYEDMVAREICSIFYTGGVIVKKPFVRPFEGGFEMTFTILPTTPDLDSSGKEKHYVRSLGEALRVIEKDLLVDIQTKVYAADKLPEVTPVYEGLKLTCYLNHFQGQYPIKDGEQKPQRALISEHGMAGAIANEIADYFHKHGIRLDFVDACQYSYDEAICWFEPEFKGKIHKIEGVLQQFQSQINNKVDLEVEMENGGEYISIVWATNAEKMMEKIYSEDGKEIVLEEPEDKTWFVDLIVDPKSVHHMIHGPTGTGKSVLVDNICCVTCDNLSAQTGMETTIKICDPKYPDTVWTYRGQRIRPEYRKWNGAFDGVLAMRNEVEQRISLAAEAADKVPDELYADPDYVLPMPSRNIELWVVDEAAALHERNKDEVGQAFRETAWVARSALVKMILVGQNPNCSNYGLQIPDLANFVRWYLGITALEALDKVIKPPRELKAKLKAQIYARLRITKQKKRQGIKNPKEQYFALVWSGQQEPFVAQLPPPKAYAHGTQAIQEPHPDSIQSTPEQTKTHLLELLWDNSDQLYVEHLIETLPKHLKDVYAFAQERNRWITTREFRRTKNAYKKCTAGLIEDWFNELESLGLGRCSHRQKTLIYHWKNSTDSIDN